MKKFLLLFVAVLLPVFVFGQAVQVKWNGPTTNVPTITNSTAISAGNIGGSDFSMVQWEGFRGINWPIANAIDPSKYIEISIGAKAGYDINLNTLSFTYKATSIGKYEIRYSTNSAFPANGTFLYGENAVQNNKTTRNVSMSGIKVLAGQTLYIRFYGYNRTNTGWSAAPFDLMNSNTIESGTTPTITGTAASAVPTAVNDENVPVAHNTATPISVLSNDQTTNLATGIDIVSGQGPANGTAVPNGSNQVVYTPTNGFTGVNTFKYRIKYGTNSFSNEATVTVNVAPRANNDTATAGQNQATTINVLGNDVYATGFTPTINIVSPFAANGNATVSSGQIVYTSTGNFTGQNTIRYTITNAHGTSAVATVTVNVVPPRPIAVDDSLVTTAFNTATTISVLANDSVNGLPTTVALVSGQGPANGTATVNASNQVVYTPTAGFTGTDTFQYTLTNANGTSVTAATVTVNVAPRANNDSANTYQNTAITIPVLSNDVYNTAIAVPAVTITQNPANGTATVNASKQVVYTPATGFTGTNTFQYTITNANGTSTATVSVNVAPPLPVAVDDTATTMQNNAVTIDVIGNDIYNNSAPTVAIFTQSSYGVATVNASNQVVFTPSPGYAGTTTFKYKITNANGTSATAATVIVTVNAPVAPTASPDSYPVPMNVFTDLNVLANDNLGSAASVTSITPTVPAHGTVSVNANNTIRYTPTTGYTGNDSFNYSFTTTYGTTQIVAVTLLVGPQVPASGPLCGTYYIGTGGHFATLTQAVNYLNTNGNGINCDVTFLLINTNYNNNTGETFPITFNAYAGSNTYTLTVKPNTSVNTTVQANNVGSPVPSVFKFNGARRVIFDGSNSNTASKNFTVINNCPIDYANRTVFALTGSYNTVTLKNLQITQAHENGAYAFAAGIYAGGDNIGNAGTVASANLVISSNDFSGVKQGIYVNNNNNTTLTGVSIFGNRFGQNVGSIKAQNAIHLGGVANFSIYQNQVKDVNSDFNADDYRGIYVNGNNGSIYKNTIYNIKRNGNSQSISGIWLKSNVGNNAVNVTVYNNFITDVQTPGATNSNSQGAYGLFIEEGNGFKIYHNSVNLKQQSQTTGISAALFVKNGTNLDVRNNIFNNNLEYDGGNAAGRASVGVMNYSNSTFANLDYNNYFSKGVIGIRAGNIDWVSYDNNTVFIQTLAQWRTATSKDANTTNIQPVFVNENNDLHLVPGNTINVQYLGGVTGLGIVDDIDGEARYVQRPTMGADEIAETHCGNVVTWDGTSWNPAQPAGWKGNENVKIIIAGPYPMGSASLLKSCQLEIAAGAVLTIGNGSTYIVEDKLTLRNGSTMIVEDNGSFVQVSEPDINEVHPGAVFQVHRKSETMYRYDFTYWSSPVEGFRLKDVSPMTFFDKFYSWNSTTQAWTTLPQPANSITAMQTGIGYIVRAPQSYNTDPAIRDTWESIFKGRPNNGAKQVTVANGTDNKWNLIGNPYASAIDVNTFMTANANVIEGAIYLWTHNSAIVPVSNGSNIYTYSASDYVTVNAAGKVAAGPQNNSLGVDNGDDFKIASGQSFFVKGKVSNAVGNQVKFNNGMRVKQEGQNDQFFRPSPANPNQDWETTGKHRVWLNMTGANNAFNQLMVGYIEDATNGLDSRFDADVFSGGAVSMYSLLEDKKLTIQGRALPFNNQDEVPLGYKTTLTGTLKIAIDHFDGLFEGQNVYLEDKVFNIVHNLKESDYMFTTAPGTFNDRFVLRYAPAADLGVDNPTVDANSIVVFRNDNKINIKSHDQSIEQVTVYDLLGKVIFDKNKINATSFSTTQLNASNQVVIVKIITDMKAEVVKKVIMN